MDDNDTSKILPFVDRENGTHRRGQELPDGGDTPEAIAPGDIYATVTGGRQSVALEFILLDGDAFVVPYSYRPLFWWKPPHSLVIEYPTLFSVSLRGKELAGLYARIRDQKVTWVRQVSEQQAANLPAAVTGIDIIHAYPSRAG